MKADWLIRYWEENFIGDCARIPADRCPLNLDTMTRFRNNTLAIGIFIDAALH